MKRNLRLQDDKLVGKSIDALSKILNVQNEEKLSVYAYRDKSGGFRIAEVSVWTHDQDGNLRSGYSWMRSDPDCASIILGVETFLLTYGKRPTKDFDEHADSVWYLKEVLNASK